ncbi:pseudouridine synthase [Candidatus Merdisoma sp. HCP28S3_D10]|uniref:pseudouridine synthase n=1 Tax=unclassified Candidatus Merdisoma TaxID=3099611 RepID=UPI003F8C6BE9
MRLDKYLCEAGFGTRSEVKKLLRSGVVTVNDTTATKPEAKLQDGDRVFVSGKEVSFSRVEYWMLHKPAGYISATEDRKLATVLELLPENARSDLFPVGRLDRDTEGLLLLTNDGKLAHYLLSPKRHVDKTYYARIRGQVKPEHVQDFLEGLDIGDEKKTLPAKLRILKSGQESEIEVTIREGRYHQVKRMFEAIDCEVTYLKRLSMGSLKLDESLAPGECRLLYEKELRNLKEETGCSME